MRIPEKILVFFFFSLIIFSLIIWLTKNYWRNIEDIETKEDKLSLSACGWLPWWDYQRAEKEFLVHQEIFDTISPFVFLLNKEGEVEIKIDNLVDKIKTYKKDPRMKVVPSIYNDFDEERISQILNSESLRQQHIEILLDFVQKTGADGIEVDYEYLKEEDKKAFSLFIKLLAQALHKEKKLLSVTLHPKTSKSSDWHGAKAQDWETLGKEADLLRIMAYDFSWRTSGPGPIAPLWWVQEVISFAKAKIPADKIVMGLPLYGYDWLAGSKEAEELTLAQIQEFIQKEKITVSFDSKSNSPFLDYRDKQGKNHQIWFEDKDSLLKKIEAIQAAGLDQICFWRLGGTPQNYYEFIKNRID